MTTIGDKYLLTGSGRSDHDRLRVISEIHDGRTRELLLRAGLAPGQRFVEFGCGLGYVARWAAGQGAYATGIDLNPVQQVGALRDFQHVKQDSGRRSFDWAMSTNRGSSLTAWTCPTRAG